MVKLARIPHSGKVDISEWDLGSLDDIADKLMRDKITEVVSEAIATALTDKVDAYFPIMWSNADEDGINGAAVTDPAILYISLPFSADEGNESYWQVSLKELVERQIEYVTNGNGDMDTDDAPLLTQIRDMFHELAGKIDQALSHGGEREHLN